MPLADNLIDAISEQIDNAEHTFVRKIPKIQTQLFGEISKVLENLDTTDGRLVYNARNIQLINEFEAQFRDIILSSDYTSTVTKYMGEFPKVTKGLTGYFKRIDDISIGGDTLNAMQKEDINATLQTLLGDGLNRELIAPTKQIISDSVVSGLTIPEAKGVLREFTTKTAKGAGALDRYANVIATDALNQHYGRIQTHVAEEFGFNAFRYTGSLIATSRPQCRRWVAKVVLPFDTLAKEISWANNNGSGMIKDTKPKTFGIYRGGYACRHRATAIRIGEKGSLKKRVSEPIPPKKVTAAPTTFTPAKTIKEAEGRIESLGVKKVSLKGMKTDQANAVLMAMENEAAFKQFSLDELVTYRDSRSTNMAIYSPSNNKIGLNLSNVRKLSPEKPPKPYKIQVEEWEASKKSWEENSKYWEAQPQTRATKRSVRKTHARVASIEQHIKRLNVRIEQGESPKYWSIPSSQKTTDKYLEAAVRHEMGHYRDYQQRAKSDWINFNKKRAVSDYAEVNEREYFAEAYTAYFMGDRKSVPQDILKLIESW